MSLYPSDPPDDRDPLNPSIGGPLRRVLSADALATLQANLLAALRRALPVVRPPEPDEDTACPGCGHTPCDCDTRCPDCHQPYRDEDEQARGQCTPCYGDALDAQRDEVA